MKKGFTLLELLIVIGILAILATIVVVVLNPAEYLAQARDTQRLADLGAVRNAVAIWLATATSTTFYNAANTYCTFHTGSLTVDGAACTYTGGATTSVDLNGWVRVDLRSAQGGSPIAALPVDPTNNTTYFYAYKGDDTNKVFELDVNLESTKYSGKESIDGGDAAALYELGTDPALDLI